MKNRLLNALLSDLTENDNRNRNQAYAWRLLNCLKTGVQS